MLRKILTGSALFIFALTGKIVADNWDYNYINYNTIALVWSLNFIQQKAAGLDQKIIYSQCIPPTGDWL